MKTGTILEQTDHGGVNLLELLMCGGTRERVRQAGRQAK